MRRHLVKLWAFILLLTATSLVAGGQAEQQKAVAIVKALGGQVEAEGGDKGGTIVTVSLGGCDVTDADLAHLKSLTGLQRLDL
jgi:hypothetical protein